MWVEHSAQIHTWVHPSGPTPQRHHQELGRGWVVRRIWTQSRTLELGKGCRWWGARIDAVPSASADRSRFREAPRRAGHCHKGEDPRTVEVLAALVDSASQTIPVSCRVPADVQAFFPSGSLTQVRFPQNLTSAPGDSLRGPAGSQARSRGARPAPPA